MTDRSKSINTPSKKELDDREFHISGKADMYERRKAKSVQYSAYVLWFFDLHVFLNTIQIF